MGAGAHRGALHVSTEGPAGGAGTRAADPGRRSPTRSSRRLATHGARLSEDPASMVRRARRRGGRGTSRDCSSIRRRLPQSRWTGRQWSSVDGDAASGGAGDADVRAEVEAGLSRIIGDPARLRQALRNLVDERDRPCRPLGGRAGRAGLDGDLADRGDRRGDGIAVEDQHRIFEPGVRLDPGNGQGAELGLSVVARGGRRAGRTDRGSRRRRARARRSPRASRFLPPPLPHSAYL